MKWEKWEKLRKWQDFIKSEVIKQKKDSKNEIIRGK